MKYKFFFPVVFFFLLVSFVSSQGLPVNEPAPKGYMLGPGDEIIGKVMGEKDFDFVATVNEDGNIEVPFSDKPVIAKCRTETELKNDVTVLLAKYLRKPQLSVQVTKRNSRADATIYGEVQTPQKVELRRKATLVELIAFAGGVKDEAGGMVQVFRTQRPLCGEGGDSANWQRETSDPTEVPSRVYSLASVRAGMEDSNPIIYPGDVIVIPKAFPVYITGEVMFPQGILLKDKNLSLAEALAMIGGVRREAKTKDIKIYRRKPNSKEREVISANYDLIKKLQQKDVILQPYDLIEVDRAKESIPSLILKFVVGAGKAAVTAGANSVGYRTVLY